VAAGYEHTCGVDTTGAAWCWGDDGFGQVGDGDEYVPAF
jgi:alpha-tubulin suppressor-like RCC1 family protein